MSTPWNAAYCATCAETGRRGYCAPAGCYCGHETCHAYASWQPLKTPDITIREVAKASAWDEREDSTWIDRL